MGDPQKERSFSWTINLPTKSSNITFNSSLITKIYSYLFSSSSPSSLCSKWSLNYLCMHLWWYLFWCTLRTTEAYLVYLVKPLLVYWLSIFFFFSHPLILKFTTNLCNEAGNSKSWSIHTENAIGKTRIKFYWGKRIQALHRKPFWIYRQRLSPRLSFLCCRQTRINIHGSTGRLQNGPPDAPHWALPHIRTDMYYSISEKKNPSCVWKTVFSLLGSSAPGISDYVLLAARAQEDIPQAVWPVPKSLNLCPETLSANL